MTTLDEAIEQLQLTEVFAAGWWDYEWNEFKAWKAPSGRFYWYQDSGCSCTTYGEHFTSAADFSDGARTTLERAFRKWRASVSNYDVVGVIEAMEQLRQLRL